MLVAATPTILITDIDIDKAKGVGNLAPCILWRDIGGKKVPVGSSGRSVNPLDPANQLSFTSAAQIYMAVPSRYTGIGVVLSGTPRADGLVLTVLDYDAKGSISVAERARRDRVAEEHTILFNSYTETSVSGVGRHIVIWARPIGRNLKLGHEGEIEIFQQKRFVALTGQLNGTTNKVEARPDELDQVLATLQGRGTTKKLQGAPLRLVAGIDLSPITFGSPSKRFENLPVDSDLAAGIYRSDELPSTDEVEQWCSAIIRSSDALRKLGQYDVWVSSLGFPLAHLARDDQQSEGVYRKLFLEVSAAAPKYDEGAAKDKWSSLLAAAGQGRDEPSTWRSLRHFARQHGYVAPAAEGSAASGSVASITGLGSVPDPLRFVCLPSEEAVARINTEFFVLQSSGKIYRQNTDGELHALPKQDFKTVLGGRWVEIDNSGSVKRRSAADAWLDAPQRREYRGLQYCPNNIGLKPNHLNLWTGWGDVTPAQGDCSILIDHLKIVADGDPAKGDFLLNWLADILQNPTRKPGVCVVLRGRQGCGKTVVGAIARKLLGPKNVLTVNEKDRMLGRFNSSVMNKILLVGEEMLFAGDRATTDKLKHLITGQTLPVEFKFGDALEIESHHRLLLTSNHEQVFQAAGEERRFVIYDVSDARRGDSDYFDKLYAVADGRDDATAAAFMKFLLERDLTSFQPWKEQQCFAADAALLKQKVLSLPPPLAWLQEVIDTVEGQGPPDEEYYWSCGLPYRRWEATVWGQPRPYQWPPQFPRSQALAAFRDWTNKVKPFGASEYTASPERFWKEICKVIPRGQTNRQTTGGVRNVTIDLTDLQKNFENYLRGEVL
jgi:hypothetical protein